MHRARNDGRTLRLVFIGPLRLCSNSGKLPIEYERSDIHGDKPSARALATIRVSGSELHLDGRRATVLLAVEVREVPAGGNEVRAHALDRMHKHAGAFDGLGLALVHDETRREVVGPEAVDHVALWILRVGPEVRKTAFGALADLEARGRGGARDVEGDLQLVVEVRGDGVRLGRVGSRLGLVRNRELVSFA